MGGDGEERSIRLKAAGNVTDHHNILKVILCARVPSAMNHVQQKRM